MFTLSSLARGRDAIITLMVAAAVLFAMTRVTPLAAYAQQGSVSAQAAAAQLEASAKKVLQVESDIALARGTLAAADMHFKAAQQLMTDGRAKLSANDYDAAFRLFQDAHFRANTASTLLRGIGIMRDGNGSSENGSGGGEIDIDSALLITAETNKAVYRIGEPIEVVVRATNLSNVSMKLSFPSSCQVFYFVDNRQIAPDACAMALSSTTIKPKSTKLWLNTYAASGELTPGEHRVRAQVVGYGTVDLTITMVR